MSRRNASTGDHGKQNPAIPTRGACWAIRAVPMKPAMTATGLRRQG